MREPWWNYLIACRPEWKPPNEPLSEPLSPFELEEIRKLYIASEIEKEREKFWKEFNKRATDAVTTFEAKRCFTALFVKCPEVFSGVFDLIKPELEERGFKITKFPSDSIWNGCEISWD